MQNLSAILEEAGSSLLQDRAEILQRLLCLSVTPPPTIPLPSGARPSWPATKTRPLNFYSLVVGRSLEQSGRALGADDLLLCHLCSPSRVRLGVTLPPKAAPSALKMASRTWRESSPSMSLDVQRHPVAWGNASRKRAARSPPRHPRALGGQFRWLADADERPLGDFRAQPGRALPLLAGTRSRVRGLRRGERLGSPGLAPVRLLRPRPRLLP